MIPGKKYTPEDYLRMAWKRKWLILIPGVIAGIGTMIYTQQLPNRYRASTTIMIVPQQVPEDMVRSTVTARVDDRLNMISQEILSRTRLERIIEELGLYPEERANGAIMQDLVERMRLVDVKLVPIQSRSRNQTDAFTLSFESENPKTAMAVATKLADAFVGAQMADRSNLAESTSEFLNSHVDEAKRRLMSKEQELAEYRLRHAGQLPSEAGGNMTMLQATQGQLQALYDAVARDQEQLQRLEGEAATILAMAPREATGGNPATMSPARQELAQAQMALRALELRYKPGYPDIDRKKAEVAQLQLKVEAEDLQQPVSASTNPGVTLPAAAQARLAQIRIDRDEIQNRIKAARAKEGALTAQIARYQANLNATPARETELIELMRDYGTYQQAYNDLLRKSWDSKLSVNLERREIGERFKTIDGARVPEKPFYPVRSAMNIRGFMIGLGIGLALVVLLEYRDTTVKTDVDVVTALTLPVLAVIPVMLTESEQRRAKRVKRMYIWAGAAAVMIIAVVTVVAWHFGLIDRLVR